MPKITFTKEEIFDNEDWAFEEFLHGAFVNLSNEPCHPDSYMAIVDFKVLGDKLEQLEEQYSPNKEDWQRLTDSILSCPNHQPPMKIVASHILHKYDCAGDV